MSGLACENFRNGAAFVLGLVRQHRPRATSRSRTRPSRWSQNADDLAPGRDCRSGDAASSVQSGRPVDMGKTRARSSRKRSAHREALGLDVRDCVCELSAQCPTPSLGLKEAGVALDNTAGCRCDPHFCDQREGRVRDRDVGRGPMLAHKAEDKARSCGNSRRPAGHVITTLFQALCITRKCRRSQTEEELKQAAWPTHQVNSRSPPWPLQVNQTTEDFVKVSQMRKTDRVLGVHIVGREAGEMIHEAAVLMEFGGSAEDLARTLSCHPTRSEASRTRLQSQARIHM